MLASQPVTDQTTQPALDASATPILQKPKAPTTPTDSSGSLPLATAPTLSAGTTQPAPLNTSDPLAFSLANATSTPYTAPGGQTFVGGTQTPDSNGLLGQQVVPGSNGGLVDLGGGMFAPTNNSGAGSFFGAPSSILTAGGAAPTQDQSLQAGLYGTSAYDSTKAGFSAVYRGPTGDLIFAAPGFNPDQLPTGATLVSGTAPFQGAPSAANGGGSSLSPGAANDVTPNTGAALSLPGGGGLTPGAANDAGTPSIPQNQGTATAQAAGANGMPFAPGVNLTPTTVDNALTNDTITPGPMADRFKIAQDQWQNFVNATQPQYDAQLRDAERNAFGAGRGVSGALRTSLGDLANQRSLALDTQKNDFLNNALSGSIEDAYRNIGIAQQQQGFQAGQQGTAFNQALQQLLAGSSGDPSQIALILSSIFGGQGGNLGQAVGNYTAAQTANNNTQFPSWLLPYLTGGQASTDRTDPILQNGMPGVQTIPGGGY